MDIQIKTKNKYDLLFAIPIVIISFIFQLSLIISFVVMLIPLILVGVIIFGCLCLYDKWSGL